MRCCPSSLPSRITPGGWYYIRAGWDVDSHHGFMQNNSPIRGNGGQIGSWQPNNVVHIHGYGAELLFLHNDSPVLVDGSKPMGDSPLYAAPFTLTESATVRARAFRRGVTRVPAQLSGVEVSAVTTADYVRLSSCPAVTAGPLQPGLEYAYFEGDWHEFRYADSRGSKPDLCFAYKENRAQWDGDRPALTTSGPGLPRQPIPERLLWRVAADR